MKTRKVLDLNAGNLHLVGYFHTEPGTVNPWRLYKVWYDNGYHKKLVDKWANFISLMEQVHSLVWDDPEAWRD